MKVFQQRLVVDEHKHGRIGLARHGGLDVMTVTSFFTNPVEVTAVFPVATIPRLVELLQNAYNTSTRRADGALQFEKLK